VLSVHLRGGSGRLFRTAVVELASSKIHMRRQGGGERGDRRGSVKKILLRHRWHPFLSRASFLVSPFLLRDRESH
jgi:hypothetical protein